MLLDNDYKEFRRWEDDSFSARITQINHTESTSFFQSLTVADPLYLVRAASPPDLSVVRRDGKHVRSDANVDWSEQLFPLSLPLPISVALPPASLHVAERPLRTCPPHPSHHTPPPPPSSSARAVAPTPPSTQFQGPSCSLRPGTGAASRLLTIQRRTRTHTPHTSLSPRANVT
jgi:hypothetical protein